MLTAAFFAAPSAAQTPAAHPPVEAFASLPSISSPALSPDGKPLLMHGEADTTVRIDQSEAMDSALRRAGKPVTFIRIPKETHYMQTEATRVRWLTELEKFLRQNIGN